MNGRSSCDGDEISTECSSNRCSIVSPTRNFRGRSYGEWSAEWWQFVYSTPLQDNIAFDESGENSSKNQSSPVWFLAGTFGGNAERNVTIPAGMAILIPILNCCYNRAEDGEDLTELELRIKARKDIDKVIELEAVIDGESIGNLEDFRVESPIFNFKVPDANPIEKLKGHEGQDSQGISDGYWILLESITIGVHTIHFRGIIPPNFELDVNYKISVRPLLNDTSSSSNISAKKRSSK
jgi:hypothetical protein